MQNTNSAVPRNSRLLRHSARKRGALADSTARNYEATLATDCSASVLLLRITDVTKGAFRVSALLYQRTIDSVCIVLSLSIHSSMFTAASVCYCINYEIYSVSLSPPPHCPSAKHRSRFNESRLPEYYGA